MDKPIDWTKVDATYNEENNKFLINASATDFVPKYLKYVMEYLKVPADAEIIFLKDKK